MLTALHCLQKNAFSSSDPFVELKKIMGLDPTTNESSAITFVAKNRLPQINIEFPVGLPGYQSSDETKIKVIALGRGWPLKFPSDSSSESVLHVVRDSVDDWALIKLEQIPKDYSCVRIATQKPASGELVFLTGHPKYVQGPVFERLEYLGKNVSREAESAEIERWERAWAEKTRGAFEDRHPIYISSGLAFPNFAELFREVPAVAESLGFADEISDPNIYFASTAPSMGGFSGGGGFDRNGALVGINSMKPILGRKYLGRDPLSTDPLGNNFEFRFGTSLISVEHIQKELQTLLGVDTVQTVFSCE